MIISVDACLEPQVGAAGLKAEKKTKIKIHGRSERGYDISYARTEDKEMIL